MKDVSGLLLAIAAIGLIIAVFNPNKTPSAIVGAGITAANPRLAVQKAKAAAKRRVIVKKATMKSKQTQTRARTEKKQSQAQSSGESQALARAKAAAAAKQAALRRAKALALARARARARALALAQARARMAATQNQKIQAAVSNALRQPNLTPAKRKLLLAASVALNGINKNTAALPNPTPAAIQQVKARWRNWLYHYATKVIPTTTTRPTTQTPGIRRVNTLGMSGLTGEDQILTGGGSKTGGFRADALKTVTEAIMGGNPSDVLGSILVGEEYRTPEEEEAANERQHQAEIEGRVIG